MAVTNGHSLSGFSNMHLSSFYAAYQSLKIKGRAGLLKPPCNPELTLLQPLFLSTRLFFVALSTPSTLLPFKRSTVHLVTPAILIPSMTSTGHVRSTPDGQRFLSSSESFHRYVPWTPCGWVVRNTCPDQTLHRDIHFYPLRGKHGTVSYLGSPGQP